MIDDTIGSGIGLKFPGPNKVRGVAQHLLLFFFWACSFIS